MTLGVEEAILGMQLGVALTASLLLDYRLELVERDLATVFVLNPLAPKPLLPFRPGAREAGVGVEGEAPAEARLADMLRLVAAPAMLAALRDAVVVGSDLTPPRAEA